MKKMAENGRNVYLGQNPSEIDVRSYARIKNVIWDQLLATKTETIQC